MLFRHAYQRARMRRWCRACVALALGLVLAPGGSRAGSPVTGTFTFSGSSGNVTSFAYNGGPITNLTVSSLDKVGVSSSSNTDNFRASNWALDTGSSTLTGSIDSGEYFGFSLSAAAGYTFDIRNVTFGFGRSPTGPRSSQWRSSLDNYAAPISSYSSLGSSGLFSTSSGALSFTTDSSSTSGTNVVLALSGSSAAYTGLSTLGLRWYAYNAEASVGTGGFQGPLTFTVEVNSTGGGIPYEDYQPPAGYYASATGTGAALKAQLNAIIDGHTALTYDELRTALQVTDADPANPGRTLLAYTRVSLDTSAINPSGPIPGWDNGLTWNREHTWADSRGLGGGGPDYTDLHHLRAINSTVNSTRGNKNFGGAYGVQPYGAVTDNGAAVWYPGDADAGMVARHEFYMATRYDGADPNTIDLELLPGDPTEAQGLGSLTRMVEWHYQAVPDEFELRRNQTIYTDYQGNRNPYVDNPEYVWSVFVDQANDSQLYVGAAPAASGSSSLNVNLGRVITDGAVPSAQSVTLRRNGNDGTYFHVTTSGSATSSLLGKFNAFPINTTGSDFRSLSVGLDTSTAQAGLKSGTVSIDNLDVTTAGGTGRGANDATDSIDVSLSVLDHAMPSFVTASTSTSVLLNFGTLTQGAPASVLSFDIFNRSGDLGSLWTAGLDLDEISEVDANAVFSTTLEPFLNLAAGSFRSATVSLSTAVVGSFSGSYLLSFSDEDLPGATTTSMRVSMVGSVAPVPEPPLLGAVGVACTWSVLAVRKRRRTSRLPARRPSR